MSTSSIALVIAFTMVVGMVVSVAGLSLVIGAVEFLFGKPRLKLHKSQFGDTGFAFKFSWNAAKEPATFDVVKVRLFNPFGRPSQVEVYKDFDGADSTFTKDVDLGPGFRNIVNAQGIEQARITVELSSTKDGIDHTFEMKASKFKDLLRNAAPLKEDASDEEQKKMGEMFWTVSRDHIADTVPGKGAQVAIPTNPAFAQYFSSAGGGAAAGEAKAQENFSVSKVWIAPGCIVCNACEDIYPEVFDVQADTCLIKPDAPLNDGLRIEEAAEACPVEVIKYERA